MSYWSGVGTILKSFLSKSFLYHLAKVIRAGFLGCVGTVRPTKAAVIVLSPSRPRVLTMPFVSLCCLLVTTKTRLRMEGLLLAVCARQASC